jgi:hypothetical protein
MSFDPSEPTLYENILSKEVIVLSLSVIKVCTIAVVIFLLYSFILICESGYLLHLYLVIYLFFWISMEKNQSQSYRITKEIIHKQVC